MKFYLDIIYGLILRMSGVEGKTIRQIREERGLPPRDSDG